MNSFREDKRVALLRPSGMLASIRSSRLAGDAFWVVFGKAASILVNLVAIRILTEFTPPGVFGAANLLLAAIPLMNGTLLAPIAHTAQRFTNSAIEGGFFDRFSHECYVLMTKLIVIPMALVICMVAFGLITSWLEAIAFAFLIAIEGVRMLEQAFLTARREQKSIAIWTVLDAFARPSVAVLLAWLVGASSFTLILGYAIGSGLAYLATCISKPPLPNSENTYSGLDEAFRRDFKRYALPLIPMGILGWITAFGDRLILDSLEGGAAVGIYVAIYGIASRPVFAMGSAFEMLAMPIYFQSFKDHENSKAQRVFIIWVGGVAISGLIGALLMYILYPYISFLLLAESYRTYDYLLPVLVGGFTLLQIAQVFEQRLRGKRRSDLVLVVHCCVAIATLASVYICGKSYGLVGVTYASLIYYGLFALIASSLSCLQSRPLTQLATH